MYLVLNNKEDEIKIVLKLMKERKMNICNLMRSIKSKGLL